jgi:hypothetical protein
MPCVHLRELYDLCEKHELRISSHDAIRFVCRQCQEQEVCPSSLTDGENVLKMPSSEEATNVESDQEAAAPEGKEASRPGENRPR